MLKLEELEVYQLSMDLSDEIWNLVIGWNSFEKYTIGTQFVKSCRFNISQYC